GDSVHFPTGGCSNALDSYLAAVADRPRRAGLAGAGLWSDTVRRARASRQPLPVCGGGTEGEGVFAGERRRVPRWRGRILDAAELLWRLPCQLRLPDGKAPGRRAADATAGRDAAVLGKAQAVEPATLFLRRGVGLHRLRPGLGRRRPRWQTPAI